MLFSIIIPFRNEEIGLEECIKSALKNLTSETEIILIDDFSQDNSKKIAKKYLRNNIKLISNKKNLGVSKSRNKALKIAKGDYIVFLDADDSLSNNFTQILKKKIIKNDVDFCFLRSTNLLDKSIDYNEISKTFDNKVLNKNISSLIKNFYNFRSSVWNFVIKRKIIEDFEITFTDLKIYEDQVFITKIIGVSKKFLIIKEPVYLRKSRNLNSLGRAIGGIVAYSSLKLIKESIEILLISKEMNKYYKKFIISRMQFGIQEFMMNLPISEKKMIKKFIKYYEKNINFFKKLNKIKLEKNQFILQDKNIFTEKFFEKNLQKKLISLEKDIIKQCAQKNTNLIFYCANQLSKICLKICKKNNIPIHSIIDNNDYFFEKKILSVGVTNLKNLDIKFNTKIILNHLEKKIRKKLFKTLNLRNRLIKVEDGIWL